MPVHYAALGTYFPLHIINGRMVYGALMQNFTPDTLPVATPSLANEKNWDRGLSQQHQFARQREQRLHI